MMQNLYLIKLVTCKPSELSSYWISSIEKIKILNIRKRAAQRHINFFKKYSNWLELPEMNSKCKSFWFCIPAYS